MGNVTALHLACDTAQPGALPGLLLRHGADPNSLARVTSDDGRVTSCSPLACAAARGAVETVQELIASGADPNAGDWSPLEYASTEETRTVVRAAGGRGDLGDGGAPSVMAGDPQ